jgi:hypothetical protein
VLCERVYLDQAQVKVRQSLFFLTWTHSRALWYTTPCHLRSL